MENKTFTPENIDSDFVDLIDDMKVYLEREKARFDCFESKSSDPVEQISFLKSEGDKVFSKMDDYWQSAWAFFEDLGEKDYKLYQHYLQSELHPTLEETVEVNRHIYRKPLGYPGDFMVMNYIFEYNSHKYLGKTLFEKLINSYTCNIPIALSNITRKNFFKKRISDILEQRGGAKIMSVGGGSLRELVELLDEGKINKPLTFTSVDFEKRAIKCVQDNLEKISSDKKKMLKMNLVEKNVLDIVRGKDFNVEEQDMIYASGLFDYLGDRISKRLIMTLFEFLKEKSNLIVCNISRDKSSHRAYYEALGEWNMIHRNEDELLEWTKGLNGRGEVKFEVPEDNTGYLYLNIGKP